MKVLLTEKSIIESIEAKTKLFLSLLVHPRIKAVHSFGLWIAIEFDSFETNKKIIDNCIAAGVLTDWFLFAADSLRISPPLIISEEQIKQASAVILKACNE